MTKRARWRNASTLLGRVAALTLALSGLPANVSAWSTGPPADRVGICYARPTCNDAFCHDTFPLNAGTHLSTLALDSGPLPPTYRVGELLQLLLTVDDPNPTRQRFGFELGAVADCPVPTDEGQFVVLESARTQLTSGGGLTFIEHTCSGTTSDVCGYLPAIAGTNQWRFEWQAPATPVGAITFFWAINAANGDGDPDGDYIRLWDATLVPHCPGAVTNLLAVAVDCDVATPGIREVQLSWEPAPFANGYRIYTTDDVLVLASPGTLGASVVASACELAAAGSLIFFTVVGLCMDASDGP